MISETEQLRIINGAVMLLRSLAPVDTGNLRFNAIRLENLGDGRWQIYIDETIAPYMKFTEEPWTSSKWKGKKNPNEGWFKKACDIVATYIAEQSQGTLIRGK